MANKIKFKKIGTIYSDDGNISVGIGFEIGSSGFKKASQIVSRKFPENVDDLEYNYWDR